jgi:hypothetical protein
MVFLPDNCIDTYTHCPKILKKKKIGKLLFNLSLTGTAVYTLNSKEPFERNEFTNVSLK